MNSDRFVSGARGEYFQFSGDIEKCKICMCYNNCVGNQRKKHFKVKREIFDNLKEVEEIGRKMMSSSGKDKYNKRFWLGEFVFGLITEQWKFRRFLVRGIGKVKTQWKMIHTVFNIRKMWALA